MPKPFSTLSFCWLQSFPGKRRVKLKCQRLFSATAFQGVHQLLPRGIFDDDVVDAVVCLTKLPDEKYFDYIERVKTNSDAVTVKLSDLKDNMDITRIPELTEKHLERLKKYHTAYKMLRQ